MSRQLSIEASTSLHSTDRHPLSSATQAATPADWITKALRTANSSFHLTLGHYLKPLLTKEATRHKSTRISVARTPTYLPHNSQIEAQQGQTTTNAGPTQDHIYSRRIRLQQGNLSSRRQTTNILHTRTISRYIIRSFPDLTTTSSRKPTPPTTSVAMPTSFTSSYIVPAVLLNPLVVLHAINTYASHYIPSAMRTIVSSSLFPTWEKLGPPGNADPYLDMHKNDTLCWRYTAVMVVVQILAYSKVCDNREIRKLARQAKKEQKMRFIEAEKARKADRIEVVEAIPELPQYATLKREGRARIEGSGYITPETSEGSASPILGAMSDLTDTSEEETII